MDSNISDFLPSIFPVGTVKTTDEFTYTVYETETEDEPEEEFTLSKAPINSIDEVTTVVDSEEAKLEEGVDYAVRDDEYIELLDGTRPDKGATISVTYRAESVLSRVLETVEEETEQREQDLDTVVSQKFISSASGDSLDEIGKLFGDLGERAGRDDERYRRYLSSIARVYDGRGTKESIAEAVAAVVSSPELEITTDEISYKEYFDTNEYSIRFDDFNSHRISLLYEVAEIADPSGVKFVGPIYNTGTTSAHIDEGPPVDVSEFAEFDTQADVPENHIDPIAPKEYINREVDIFDEGVEQEVIKPYKFQWAHQNITSEAGAAGGDWNQFQWGEGDWDTPQEVEWEITGDQWEFADWNRIPSQGTFGAIGDNAENLGVTDSTSSTVADKSPGDSTGVTDDLTVRFLVGQEDVSSDDTYTLEIEQVLSPTVVSNDVVVEQTSQLSETQYGDDSTTLEIDEALSSSLLSDDSAVEQNKQTIAGTPTTDDSVAYEVTQMDWGATDWGTLNWVAE